MYVCAAYIIKLLQKYLTQYSKSIGDEQMKLANQSCYTKCFLMFVCLQFIAKIINRTFLTLDTNSTLIGELA